MSLYERLSPVLFRLDPETAHEASIRAASLGLHPRFAPDPSLGVEVAGIRFPSPLGLAAGYDKGARAFQALWASGFGHVEVGTVTPEPQPGNTRPRAFRLAEDRAVINRYGFNSEGHAVVRKRIARSLDRNGRAGVLGINIGANKTSSDFADDYVRGVAAFADLADYLTVNVSSPNTPGLRDLQAREPLTDLLWRVCEARDRQSRRVPVFLKIAPDLTPERMDTIAAVTLGSGVDALIVSNTTIERPNLQSPHAAQAGGLSGRPLFEPSTVILRQMAARLGGLPLVGVGGVEDIETARAKLDAGATLVQLYSALVYRGPGLAREILTGLNRTSAPAASGSAATA